MSQSPEQPDRLTHLDDEGRARMVDVGAKPRTARRALARGVFLTSPEVRDRILAGDLPKGEALATARIAGIQAAKETARLIPLCHPLGLDSVSVDFRSSGNDGIEVEAEARCTGPTGVEMEALAAVSVACLTLYDMCKALHRDARIGGICLVAKEGGRSGAWRRSGPLPSA